MLLKSSIFKRKKPLYEKSTLLNTLVCFRALLIALLLEILQSRALHLGVLVHQVNPAYTSIIGAITFSRRYGISNHHAAALCIARRLLGFSENPPKVSSVIIDTKKGQLTLFLPVRNRNKHVWSYWAVVRKKIQAVYVTHSRTETRSSDPPSADLCNSKISGVAGEIPAR